MERANDFGDHDVNGKHRSALSLTVSKQEQSLQGDSEIRENGTSKENGQEIKDSDSDDKDQSGGSSSAYEFIV